MIGKDDVKFMKKLEVFDDNCRNLQQCKILFIDYRIEYVQLILGVILNHEKVFDNENSGCRWMQSRMDFY